MSRKKRSSQEPIKEEIPNPGSDEALYRGCTCPVLDNHYGRGAFANGESLFWISQDCPLHNPEKN